MFPKLILYKIALNLSPTFCMFYLKYSSVLKPILVNDYFWQLKFKQDFPQYQILDNYFEFYKRFTMGRAMNFILTMEDVKDIIFGDYERIGVCNISNDHLEQLTNITVEKFNCIRGDLVVIKYIVQNHH